MFIRDQNLQIGSFINHVSEFFDEKEKTKDNDVDVKISQSNIKDNKKKRKELECSCDEHTEQSNSIIKNQCKFCELSTKKLKKPKKTMDSSSSIESTGISSSSMEKLKIRKNAALNLNQSIDDDNDDDDNNKEEEEDLDLQNNDDDEEIEEDIEDDDDDNDDDDDDIVDSDNDEENSNKISIDNANSNDLNSSDTLETENVNFSAKIKVFRENKEDFPKYIENCFKNFDLIRLAQNKRFTIYEVLTKLKRMLISQHIESLVPGIFYIYFFKMFNLYFFLCRKT